jgi:hypothetical protein
LRQRLTTGPILHAGHAGIAGLEFFERDEPVVIRVNLVPALQHSGRRLVTADLAVAIAIELS